MMPAPRPFKLFHGCQNLAMRGCLLLLAFGFTQVSETLGDDGAKALAIIARSGGEAFRLTGPDDSQQLVIMKGDLDVTRDATYSLSTEEVIAVDEVGFVRPLADGKALLTASLASGETASIEITAAQTTTRRAISFPNDVVPQLTRAGCNAGSCHAAPAGKNNFHLSLLGFEPELDFKTLTEQSRGRRVVPIAPELSLLLRKATGEIAHGGGARIDRASQAYRTIARWIGEGLSYGPDGDPVVTHIDVAPREIVASRSGTQQLVVTAHMSDGTRRDITRMAEYKANQSEMCEVDEHGLVAFKENTGSTAVMVRFQEHVAAFMATVPLGSQEHTYPEPANFIDAHVFAKLRTLGIPASAECTDRELLRRASLDITGRLPTIEETQNFIADESEDRRAALIDRLLSSPGYAELFASKWSSLLRNKAGGNLEQVARETYGFHAWIQASISSNKPFDQFTRELITASGKPSTNPAVSWYRAVKDPKDQMADIAQVFLGVRIQCAQCHHHPYEKWSQDDYYGLTAFFSTIKRKEVRKLPENDTIFHGRTVAFYKNPNTGVDLSPTPLDAEALDIPASRDPRIDLADWITSPENPFFAKMLVNRYWKHFFGRGLVEPEDDIRVTNPATHPKLLTALADAFVESGYDLRELVRTITSSRAYQLSSSPEGANAEDDQNFARYYVRRMPAEVMLDAMNDVTGAKNNFSRQPHGVRAVALPDDSSTKQSFFLRVFGRPEMNTACECERSAGADLSQALHLLNSTEMQRMLSTSGGTAQTLARDKDLSDSGRIHSIYLRAVSRPATEAELKNWLAHLEKKRAASTSDPQKLTPEQADREAFEDMLWVVMNTKEFLFNH